MSFLLFLLGFEQVEEIADDEPSFSAFGGGGAPFAQDEEQSFNASGLFKPVSQEQGKWTAQLPMESPIIARTHSTQIADMKTPGNIFYIVLEGIFQ